MKQFTIRVDNQGRIAIPAKLRKEAAMEPDVEVLAFFEDGGIVIITREQALAQAQRMARAALGPSQGSVVDDFLAGRRREAKREAREIGTLRS
jgi:bifunctional DNA-binding transcriptional regulator/antitoxin component of YhaV-PrlF toxin-antitoxin module